MATEPLIIVGAGPVGLTLALALAESGIAVRVFEAEADIAQDLRASTFHPPTLDLLERFGITGELLAQGLKCPDWQTRLHPSGKQARFDLSVLVGETAHPYRLQCEQWRLSRSLLSRLTSHRLVQVHFNARVVEVFQDDSQVRATVQTVHGQQSFSAPYLVGCDGARSVVRQSMGVAFAGKTYPETTILVATTFPFHEHLAGLSNVNYCWHEAGANFSLLRLPALWRVSLYPPQDRPIEEALTDGAIRAALATIVPQAAAAEVIALRPYRVHQRIAARYRVGRLLLAGDAAHLNSPAGGMGMNGGVHDALNLAEKLAVVVQGGSDDLLDLYQRQRQPIARDQIIAQADANRRRMRETDPQRRRESLARLQAIAADRDKLKAHLMKSSMIDGLRQAAAIS